MATAEHTTLNSEFDDVTAVVQMLHKEAEAAVKVFAHSFGATVALGAAARGASVHGWCCTSRRDLRPSQPVGSTGSGR